MFKIPKVFPYKFYSDKVFLEMEKLAIKKREELDLKFKKNFIKCKNKDDLLLNKRKDLELEKITGLNFLANKNVKLFVKSFPNFKKIDRIYIELINTTEINCEIIETSISSILKIPNKIDLLSQEIILKIKRAKTPQSISFLLKKFLGKVNSYFKLEKKNFENLCKAQFFLNSVPVFRDLYTIVIVGFPNVGKSTLMKKLSGSKVEIKNYPFTTKKLLLGNIEFNKKNICQLIDTAGLLNREDKKNEIEKKVEVVLNLYANEIIFVFDLTQSCGFSIDEQYELFLKTKEIKKPISIYFSKFDIFDEKINLNLKKIEKNFKDFESFFDAVILKEKTILKSLKFNPKDISFLKI